MQDTQRTVTFSPCRELDERLAAGAKALEEALADLKLPDK